jgi:hypothetical protein
MMMMMLSSENAPVIIRETATAATTEMAKITGRLIVDVEFPTLYLWIFDSPFMSIVFDTPSRRVPKVPFRVTVCFLIYIYTALVELRPIKSQIKEHCTYLPSKDLETEGQGKDRPRRASSLMISSR